MQEMERLEVRVAVHGSPNEVADAIPFDRDETHGSYNPEYANRFCDRRASQLCPQRVSRAVYWQVQSGAFLLGAPDLAVTRFPGDERPGIPAESQICQTG